MTEQVNHPKHYNTHPSGIEAIELCQRLPFNVGTAIKYLFRWRDKENPEQDLRKAIWYFRQQDQLDASWTLEDYPRAMIDQLVKHDVGLLTKVLKELRTDRRNKSSYGAAYIVSTIMQEIQELKASEEAKS